ncbi:MAG: hypothetical protein IT472_03185 [Thermomonas sp.]|uniref:hypothetical protein n=1 Tax=Thermomonas sp. TaxID=1971895 RepID=UPI0026138076|nr:hypothetical protein [Thermomonas sp.]MCC7096167.1 hypothetical protein [Thermomonas sp.]
MATNTDLRVKISADIADIKQGLGLLRGELGQIKRAAAQSAPDASAWKRSLGTIREGVGNLVGAFVGLQAVRGIVNGVMESFDRMDRIDEIRQMIAMSSEDISRFAYAAKFSGIELDTLGKAFFFFQTNLSKNSGLLRQLGVDAPTTAGKLRQLMDVFAALPDSAEKSELAATLFGKRMGGDLIPLLNVGTQGFDELSEAAARTGNVFSDQATAGAAEFNDNLDSLKGVMTGVFNVAAQQLAPAMAAYAGTAVDSAKSSEAAAEGGKFLASVFKVVAIGAVVVKNAVEIVTTVIASMADTAITAGKMILQGLGAAFKTVGATLKAYITGGPVAAFSAFVDSAKTNTIAYFNAARNAQHQLVGNLSATRSIFLSNVADIKNAFSAAFADAPADGGNARRAADAAGNAASDAAAKGEQLRRQLAALFGDGNGNGDGKGGGSASREAARKVIEGMADQSALALDQIKRDLDALEQRYQDGGIKLADYFAQKQALQLQEIDIKIAEAQADAAAATSTEQQSRALTEIIKLQRDRAAIGPAVAREQAKAEREAAQATADNLRQRSSAVMSQMQADMGLIDAQMASFSIAPGEAETQLQAIRDRSIEQLKVLRGQMQAYLATLSPESAEYAAARLGLTQLDTDLAQLTAQQQQYKMAVADQATSSLTNFFADLATGAKSFKDAFKDMVLSFVQGLARMAAEMLAKRIIFSLFPSFGGGGGGGGGMPTIGPYSALGNVFAPGGLRAFAKGGVFAATLAGISAFAAGGAFTNRIVSDPTLFAFGAGGQFGVMGEAGPEAIMPLERGPDGRLGVTANGGGGGLVTTPIVAIGDEAVANALASAAGERVVLTHVRNNWTGLTRG